MSILRRFREWREDSDGVLTGPKVDAESVQTDEASIDGKRLYIQSSQPSNPETDDVWIDIS
jgi:hypothetical protein